MLFSGLILAFVLVAYTYQPPDRWVYACFVAIPAVLLILFVLTYMTPLPVSLRILIATFEPGSLAGTATTILFWAGVGGLILPAKK